MIHAMLGFLKSWFATALLSILIVAFVITGIYSGNVGGRIEGAVVQAGSHSISDNFFKTQFDRYQEQAQQRTGQRVSVEEAVRNGLDSMLLRNLAGEVALAEVFHRVGVRPSSRLVVNALRQNNEWFNPVTGEFDPQLYRRQLAQMGATPEEYEALLRDNVAQQHFASAASAGFQAPRTYAAVDASYALERRDADYIAIPGSALPQPRPPTDAELNAFIQSHRSAFQVPELRVITVVRFSAAALAPTMQVDAAAIEREFNFRRDTLSTPEKRSFVQVPIRQASQAAAVAAALRAGQDPAAVARSVGTEAILYDDRPRSAISDRRIGAAAFGMQAGQVSGAVQGDVGMAVLRVTRITPGHVAQLSEVRGEIENQLRARAAERRVNELTEAFDNARGGGANISEAAARVGVQAVTVGPIGENGADAQGQRNPVLTPQILQNAFHDLGSGQDGELQEVSRGEAYAVRVERVLPPTTARLEDFREPITQQYMRMRMSEAIQERLGAIQTRIRAGEPLSAIARSVGGEVGHVAGQARPSAQAQHETLGRNFLAGLFSTRLNETFMGEVRGGVAVGKVTGIHAGDLTLVAAMIEQGRQQVAQQVFSGIAQGVQGWAVTNVRPRTDLARARTIINAQEEWFPENATNATNGARNAAAR